MVNRIPKLVTILGSLILFLAFAACEQKEPDLGKEVLIRVADRIMTVLDFNSAFEIAKIAYDDNLKENPEDMINAQIRLLNQLTVEMVLLERAEELGIAVSEAELLARLNSKVFQAIDAMRASGVAIDEFATGKKARTSLVRISGALL